MLSCRAIDQRVLQKLAVVTREVSLLTSNHAWYGLRGRPDILIPTVRETSRDLARPHESHESHGLRNEAHASGVGPKGMSLEHHSGRHSRDRCRFALRVQIGGSYTRRAHKSADDFKSYIHGWIASAYRDDYGRAKGIRPELGKNDAAALHILDQ